MTPGDYQVRLVIGEQVLEEYIHPDTAEMLWLAAGLDLLAIHESQAWEAEPFVFGALTNLREGATMLRRFEMFQGDFETVQRFIEEFYEGCMSYPDATIEVRF